MIWDGNKQVNNFNKQYSSARFLITLVSGAVAADATTVSDAVPI